MNGFQCEAWEPTAYNSLSFPKEDLELNYCRNPDGHLLQPWCFTDTTRKIRKICNIPKCKWRNDHHQAIYPFGGIIFTYFID